LFVQVLIPLFIFTLIWNIYMYKLWKQDITWKNIYIIYFVVYFLGFFNSIIYYISWCCSGFSQFICKST
jgi:hypothetical protein